MSDTALCHLERLAPDPMLTTLDRFARRVPRARRARGLPGRRLRDSRRCRRSLEPLPGIEPARIGTIATMSFGTTNGHTAGNGNGTGDGASDYTPIWPMVPGTRKISVTINGQQVEAEEGQTILQACRVLGIEIPTLCYEPKLAPYGACRICVGRGRGPRRHADLVRHDDRPRGWSSPPTRIGSSRTGGWSSS